MEISEINKIYDNKFYDAEHLRSIAFRLMREEGIDEEEKVLQACLKEGLYDSVYDGDNLIGIKLTLKRK